MEKIQQKSLVMSLFTTGILSLALGTPAAIAANPCNPCAAKPAASKAGANPCAAKNPCTAKNPCAVKTTGAKKKAANPCAANNPCAAKK